MTNNSQKVYTLGQSLWYDNILRRLLENGEMKGMIERGEIYGVTSNPSIFNNAIGKTGDYDDDLIPLAQSGKSANEIYEALAIGDIRNTADLFSELYNSTKGGDGYISLEVNPDLANDTDGTCDDAQRLWDLVDRPNLMVKIPATKAGLPAIQRSIAYGLNINVTLIFSVERYLEVMEAYISGLEERANLGLPIDEIASVASFFISRIDTKIDGWLGEVDGNQADLAKTLQGKVAIANAKNAYQKFLKVFGSERFAALKAKGARLQRPLWASTSTKNPAYLDILYLNELIGVDTVNTVPPKTLTAFIERGVPEATLERGVSESQKVLADLNDLGISLSKATKELEEEGVAAFSKAFSDLIDTVEVRRKEAIQK